LSKTVSIITLGCKVNFSDSEKIGRDLTRLGYSVVFDDTPADLSIVNTCAVTARADYQSRQSVRRASRISAGVPVIVSGCSASLFPERMRAAEPSSVVVGPAERESIGDLVRSLIGDPNDAPLEAAAAPRTRAFVKIQDGCSAGCAYCIVPRARGPERSIPAHRILSILTSLVNRGYREIVLVGIHLGRYGNDLNRRPDTLAGLLREIESHEFPARIRLSSIEPMELTDDLMTVLTESRQVVPHLHIPLQSGDDSILSAMGRPYRQSDFIRIVRSAAERIGDPAIGLDVMVGFPGEGDSEFLNTLQVIRSLPVTYLHVFPFSRRPGTRAYSLEGQVPADLKKVRARITRELGIQKKADYVNTRLGKTSTVLVERYDNGVVWGKSENYLDVYLPGSPDDINRLLPVVLERPFRNGIYGSRSA
jgi:threonylcarbamoyladenosine tRNA methylthiotransferase MtaB